MLDHQCDDSAMAFLLALHRNLSNSECGVSSVRKARGQMCSTRIAPLDKRSVNLFYALNANDCAKLKFQELASNVHICPVEGHVVAIEAKGIGISCR